VKDSARFFLKLDFAILGGALALGSFFKADGSEFLLALATHRLELKILGALIVYGLVFDLAITWLRNEFQRSIQPSRFGLVVSICNYALAIQVISHVFIVWGLVQYALGFLSGVSSPSRRVA
jgi:hypothetical protein